MNFFVILDMKSPLYIFFLNFLTQLSGYSIISRFSFVFSCFSHRFDAAYGCHCLGVSYDYHRLDATLFDIVL